MTIFKPPTPTILASGGGGGNGTSLNTSDASVILNTNPDTGVSNVVLTTNNNQALVINESQNVLIGTSTTPSSQRLVVTTPSGDALALINESTQAQALLNISSIGSLSIRTSGNTIDLTHNTISLDDYSLILNGITLAATATQLNYLIVTPGSGSATKALVLDANSNIAGIQSLSAARLTGTIQTAYQPNINRVTNLNIDSTLSLAGTSVLSTANELNYVHINPGSASANKALVLDSNSSIFGIGSLSASQLIGTLQTASQPNITSLGNLSNLNVSGRIGIGTTSPTTDLELFNVANPVLKLNNGTASSNITIDSNGSLILNSAGNILIQSNRSIQLNGTGSLIGANRVSATYLSGLIDTASQPNITTIGTLTNLLVTGTIGLGTSTPAKKIEIVESGGDCLRLTRTTTHYTDFLINSNGDLQILPFGDILLGSGTSLKFTSGTIIGLTSIVSTNITGTIQTASQPNITSIGTLGSLSVTNGISSGSLSATNITGTIQTASQTNITQIGTLGSLSVTNGISAGSVSASTLTGTIQTASQLNITSVGTLGSLAVTNGISAGSVSASTFTGTIQTANQPNITSIGALTNLTISSTLSVLNVNATNLSGQIQTASQPNITSVGTLFSLGVSGLVSAGSLSASTLTGVLQTASQPNVTAVGTLESLSVTNGISAGSVTASTFTGVLQTANQLNVTAVGTLNHVYTSGRIGVGTTNPTVDIDIVSAGGQLIQGTYNSNSISLSISADGDCVLSTNSNNLILSNGTGLVFSGSGGISGLTSLTATNLTGTLQTAAQPNITSVGTLSTLSTRTIYIGSDHSSTYDLSITSSTGRLISLNQGLVSITHQIISGNYVISSTSGSVVLDTNMNLALNGGTITGLTTLTSSSISGTLQTASQPIITSLGTLTNIVTSGTLTIGSTAISESNIQVLSGVTAGTVSALKALVVDINKDISTIRNLTAINLYGSIQTASQPNITTIGALTNITVGSTLFSESDLSVLHGVTPGNASASKAIILDSNSAITGLSLLGTTAILIGGTNLGGTEAAYLTSLTIGTASASKALVLDSSSNLTGVNSFGVSTISIGGTSLGSPEAAYLTSLTAGNASASKALVLDSSLAITGIHSISTNALIVNGVNITSNGSGATSEYLTNITPGTAAASKALVLSSNSNISGINSIGSTQITIGNSSYTTMPLEIGYTSFVMSGAYAYNTNANSHGTIAAGGVTSYNYSIRALGRILCTQSVDVTSDRRLKYNVQNLEDDYCTKFITDTTPVSFNWINGDSFPSYGYIAQDLLRHGFSDLVNLADDQNMTQEIDSDGLISPQGIKFTISYQHIIPILAKNQKRLMQENKALSDKVDKLIELINQLTQR